MLEPIATPRLVLRSLTVSDASDMQEYRGRSDVCTYLSHGPMDMAAIERFIEERRAPVLTGQEGERALLAVELEGRVIGDVSLWPGKEEHRQAEVGWAFNPSYGGHGYATEAARAMIDLAFRTWEMHRVWAQLDPLNESSVRLCERLGMRKEAHLREESWFKGAWGDLAIYGILSVEW